MAVASPAVPAPTMPTRSLFDGFNGFVLMFAMSASKDTKHFHDSNNAVRHDTLPYCFRKVIRSQPLLSFSLGAALERVQSTPLRAVGFASDAHVRVSTKQNA